LFEHDLFGKPVPTYPDHAPIKKTLSPKNQKAALMARPFVFDVGLWCEVNVAAARMREPGQTKFA
jgi:hypothetical protein